MIVILIQLGLSGLDIQLFLGLAILQIGCVDLVLHKICKGVLGIFILIGGTLVTLSKHCRDKGFLSHGF